MQIAVIGSGRIGAGLGRAWLSKGHAVTFGAREPEAAESRTLARETGASVASVASAPTGADVVVLAMPYAALDDVLSQVGALAGQVVIDCTNAVLPGFVLKYGHTTSSAEQLQARLPDAHVFKSFNAQGAENLANPRYGDAQASNFFCGDDARGRALVAQLVADVGFEPVDAGPLESARLLEPLMVLWVNAAKSIGTRDIAFKLLRR